MKIIFLPSDNEKIDDSNPFAEDLLLPALYNKTTVNKRNDYSRMLETMGAAKVFKKFVVW